MITIRDWIATIPEEEKHIAFVGEHQSVTREFLLTGPGWETYKDWGFHLDMAFDLSSVTNREEHKLEKTQVNNTENVTETQVKTTGTTTKESYLVQEVEVDCSAKTDIATLSKEVQGDGILLTWKVLRQHTQLPGKLTATLRALGDGGKVKKSDLMVFEVEPAVVAEPAAELPQSEFEAMEERIQEMMDITMYNANNAMLDAVDAKNAAYTAKTTSEEAVAAAQQTAKDAQIVQQGKDIALSVQDEMKGAFDRYPSNNLLNRDTVTYGKGMDKAGNIGVLEEYDLSLTDFIPVKAGDVLSYQSTNEQTGEREYGDLFSVCLFDKDKQVNLEANNFTAGEDGTLHEITVPEGVAYVRLTLYDLPTLVDPAIANCHDLVPYEPFVGVYRLKKNAYNAEDMQDLLHAVQYVSQELTDQQKEQVRQNIGAAAEEDLPLVEETMSLTSLNPISNGAVTRYMSSVVLPRLLPLADNRQTYYIPRVVMGGSGYELVPIQEDAYIKMWILPYLLPKVSDADNGKTMQVVNGTWQLV